MLARILFVLDEFAPQKLPEVVTDTLQFWNPINHVTGKVKAIQIIHHGHIKGSSCSALFFVTVNVKVVVTMSPIAQSMNEPWISVIGEDHGLICGEDGIEFGIREPVGMFTARL